MNRNIALNNRKFCFCNYEEHQKCDYENTCIKDEFAACFRAVKQEFNEETRTFELLNLFGCAPLEKGSNGSHLTCNSWRFIHSNPTSISCCYEGNYCNKYLSLPSFPLIERSTEQLKNSSSSTFSFNYTLESFIFIFIGFLIILITIPLINKYFQRDRRRKLNLKKEEKIINKLNSQSSFLNFIEDSGSEKIILNRRRIGLDLQMKEIFSKGRYGELCKAIYRGSIVAVKIFYATEEESWRNERDIYLSQMLNHENILQYIAADILSNVDSLTQMLLITDFHPLGSLYDYLRSNYFINLEEALNLSLSLINGLEHLHNSVRGTGESQKLEIAHRDIKSKNILIKRPGVCCIADFGLAIIKNDNLIKKINIQVGTKRYMAPEILNKTLNPNNFEEFKCADIYSFSLVLWEIINCIQLPLNNLKQKIIINKKEKEERKQEQNNYCNSLNSSGIASGGGISNNNISLLEKTSTTIITTLNNNNNNSFKNSNISLISENNLIIFNNQIKQQHKLPFELIIENNPSFEQMKEIVCEKKIRPPILEEWINNNINDNYLLTICNLMEECWNDWPRSRHKALKIKKEINLIVNKFNNNNI